MITRISSGETPPFRIALRPASAASVRQLSPSPQYCRLPIPERDRIHSSLVSMTFDRSSFVTQRAGSALPAEMIRIPLLLTVSLSYSL